MSRIKDKKLNKLKHQKIWPHVLGIFVMAIVFSIMIGLLVILLFSNMLNGKLVQTYDQSKKIANAFEQRVDLSNEKETRGLCDNIIVTSSMVQDICIVDKGGNIIYTHRGEIPNFEYADINSVEEDVNIFLVEDYNSAIYASGDDVKINPDKLNVKDLFEKLEENDKSNSSIWEPEEVTSMVLWYQLPLDVNEGTICLKNKVVMEKQEVEIAIVTIILVTGLSIFIFAYHLVAVIVLIFEKRKMTKILHTDVMTGGYNLTYFNNMGVKLLRKNRRRNKFNYAVISFRMEKYQSFCACYGVKEGEELMERFDQVFKNCIGKKEIVAHAENANFALLLTYSTKEALEERLYRIMSELGKIRNGQKMYFCVGVCEVEKNFWNIERMYNSAKMARSEITHDSELRIAWFNEEMHKQQVWTRKVEDDMERALANKEFQVYLQPKYSTKGEKLSGAEALVRWIHPVEGFVAPFRFIPIFEGNGFILQLDDYMLTEVARLQAKWIEEGKSIVPISVNISRAHFSREDLAEHICELVDQFNVPHDVIELELTESAFFDDKAMLLKTLKKLKEFGFTLSMDDFGAGYSSLNSLKELPLDVVKLDAEFFRNPDSDGRGDLIVGDTIALAKKLNMRIVAEGIETREQVDFLATKDCDLIQGYYFAKPMPVAEFEEKMTLDSNNQI